MLSNYIHALETRARWVQWAERQPKEDNLYFKEIFPLYEHVLKTGDSFFMDHHFCELVNNARLTIPDDLRFENSWMLQPNGFLYMEDWVSTPDPIDLAMKLHLPDGRIRAVGWHWIPELRGYQFAVFMAYGDYIKGAEGFGCWSHFAIREGDNVIDKIHEFEQKAYWEEIFAKARGELDYSNLGGYYDPRARETEMLHEIRWVFAAFHLMSLRLTSVNTHKTSTMAREIAKKKKLALPSLLKVVTLRRMQEARPSNHPGRDWQWQWRVEGHWRLQPYRSIGDYRWKFIESYIKGPADKPIKPVQQTVFIAKR